MTFFERIFGTNQTQEERVRVINEDTLLKELGEETPSGAEDLEYDPDFIALAQLIEGTPEKRVGENVIEEGRDPPWQEVKSGALALMERTHDIRATIFLLRALLRTDGLPGLRDGIYLLGALIEKYWDTLYPQLDPDDNNDPTQRVNILMGLCDRDLMILPLMKAPLCSSRTIGTFSLRDIHVATGKHTISENEKAKAANTATITAAFKDCQPEILRETETAISESVEYLSKIESFLNEKLGASSAPNFAKILQIFKEMNDAIVKNMVAAGSAPQRAPVPPPKTQEISPSPTNRSKLSNPPSKVTPMEEITSRQDVITMLENICSYYERNEPASPVPLLLKRAIGLVDKNFLAIMEDLVPESVPQVKHLGGITDT
jgi:type VI secretion system protein ImpA